jgi:hypothetical protein
MVELKVIKYLNILNLKPLRFVSSCLFYLREIGVILPSLEVRAVLFSPFHNSLRICVVGLLLLSLYVEALLPSEDGHNLTETCKGIHISLILFILVHHTS